MKIGILTHPLIANYGGILQCYALTKYLQKLGHETIVIDRRINKDFFLKRLIRGILKTLHFPRYYNPSKFDKTVKIRTFVDKYICRTLPIDTDRQMRKVCLDYNLDAVIVGSDQVWRTSYATNFGYNYFLDFVPSQIRKFSYAASFGLSFWQYKSKQNKRIKELLSEFSGISVRESEAISLLKENLGVIANQHIDPTLLLDAEEYCQISNSRLVKDQYIFVYWLGDKSLIENQIKEIEISGKKVVSVFLREDKVQISIEDWLSYIRYAEYVVTDSYHGCIFAIIFEKQFKVLKNDSGGNGRIDSLCEMLEISRESMKNYKRIQERLNYYRKISYDYLQTNLN